MMSEVRTKNTSNEMVASPSDKNALNLIRLLAAFQVLFLHAENHLKVDFLPGIIQSAYGVLYGVPIFFVVSGFLIWHSLSKTKDFKTFCVKRVFRLYPELWCGIFVSFVVVTVLYFRQMQWGPYLLFQVTQGTFLQFWTPEFLRGYGSGVPNGSLWTIGVMLQAYLVMWFLYKRMRGKSKTVWLIVNLVSVGLSFTPKLVDLWLPDIVAKLYDQTFIPYLFLFVFGMTICEFFANWICFLKAYWYGFALIALAIAISGVDVFGKYGLFKSLFIAPAVIGFAYRFPRLSIKYDYSYGIYIYHMIVINVLIHLGWVGGVWHVLLATVLSVLLAMLSYHTVGAFSRRKRKILS